MEAVVPLLRALAVSADAFPPLQSAAAAALHIAETVAQFKSNQKAWAEFGQYVQNALICVITSLPDASKNRGLKQNLERLCEVLDSIDKEIQELRGSSGRKRFWSFVKGPDDIVDMRRRLENALTIFQLSSTVDVRIKVSEILKSADIPRHLEWASKLCDKIASNLELNSLPYAEGASWDPCRVCMGETRIELLGDIWNWVNTTVATTTAEILWLTDVAGAGKSAVAHSIAQRCAEQGLLASSFFFDRESAERSSPQKLFSTIARDLANFNVDLAEQINIALERDQSLATGPISRQFDKLILKPTTRCATDQPIVIIIDALDEGYNRDLLGIFRDDVPKLPRTFRILLTSRAEDEIIYFLSHQSHIRIRTIDIHKQANQSDVASYIYARLQEISHRKRLEINWPGEQLSSELIRKAEGLFIWASTVCDYLRQSTNPDNQLKVLLSKRNPSGLPAEAKMDRLYSTILQTCNWDDVDFVEGYDLVMGAIVAAKTPLSAAALQSLHRTSPTLRVRDIIGSLGSLLTGLPDERQPIRILHLSFREFLTFRTQSPDNARFHISEKNHTQRLALLCLLALNQDLKHDIPGVGDLSRRISEHYVIPESIDIHISEELWYACRFWTDHVTEVEGLVSGAFVDGLREFLASQLVTWLEVVTLKDRFPGLVRLRSWLQSSGLEETHEFVEVTFSADLGLCLHNLGGCLVRLGRREEAVLVMEEAVELRRRLAATSPAASEPDLALSLNYLSECLSSLGHREEALRTIKEAVEMRRQLAADLPATLSPNLAMSLVTLSNHLSALGYREEALQAIQEAAGLLQRLASDQPDSDAFNAGLALSLNNLSVYLSGLGRQDEALLAINEAIRLRRKLATDQPTAFNSDLAQSLHNLSNRLSDMGRREDALHTIEEAVAIYRRLTADRPATFNPMLATSLSNLSILLSDLGRREQALHCIEEAVQLHRRLATDHPAAFSPDLALSLNNLSIRLSCLGRQEEALQAIKESVELYRNLAADHPAAFNPNLASSLNNLSVCLSDMDHREEALQVITEALTFRRQLAVDHPAAFNRGVAESLNNLSTCLFDLGRREEALHAVEEALALRRKLAADRPVAFDHDVAESLNDLSVRLSNLGRGDEALRAVEEALELRRRLATDHPATFNPDVAESLHNLSVCLSTLSRQEGAMQAILEAVELRRRLAADHPAAFNRSLALSLNHFAACLFTLGRKQEALRAAGEADKLVTL